MDNLTKGKIRRNEILNRLKGVVELSKPLTVSVIADDLGVSEYAIYYHLRLLKRQELVKKKGRRWRLNEETKKENLLSKVPGLPLEDS